MNSNSSKSSLLQFGAGQSFEVNFRDKFQKTHDYDTGAR